VLEILDTDEVSKADNVCAQTKVEDKLRSAGYQVTHKVFNSAEYGAPVSRERVITVAIRCDLAAKKQFEWPVVSTPKNHPIEEKNTVRYLLDEKPHSRYLLPINRMHEFECNNNSGQTSRARKLYTRSKVHRIGQSGSLGNPYDPNDVYSLDAPAASFTATDSDSIGTQQVNARLNKITEQRTNEATIPVFASFAGVDNLGHAVSNAGTTPGKRKVLVVGGSEIDIRARATFRTRNGFEAMYEHATVTSIMLRGLYIVVSGAPCVAYSRAGARRGRSSKLGMIYIDQIDVYIEA
jgi:site-specific DNA-cytosine methylase